MLHLTLFLCMLLIASAGCGRTTSQVSVPTRDEDELIELGRKLAATKGFNAIALKLEGNSLIVVGGSMRISGGKVGFADGDMLYNVDSRTITFAGHLTASGSNISLKPGECAVVRNGRIEKTPDCRIP